MASIFKNPGHVAKIGYNGFDMSQLVKFTSTVGELRPMYYDLLNPGDKVSLGYELKTRTMELDSAAMMSIDEHIEWFFVPMTQIFSIFGDWYHGIQDFKSSMFSIAVESTSILPYFSGLSMNNFFTYAEPDNYFRNLGGTSARLLEDFDIPVQPLLEKKFNKGFLPIFACAYQKIYFDYYRLSDREENNPEYYNLDQFCYDSSSINDALNDNLNRMLTLRYRPWKRDFFTNIFVSPLFGPSGVGSFSDTADSIMYSFHQWLSPIAFIPVNGAGTEDDTSPLTIQATNGTTLDNMPTIATPTAIRTSFALQKLLEITRRAGKHYDKQTLAHFGVKVPTGVAGEVTFIGKGTSRINIGDVIATAGTDSTPLGQVGGKGYGYGKQDNIRFTAPCHGVLMAIYSAEPVVDYDAVGYNRLNTLVDRSDWFYPEYDNLGMQPLFAYQSYMDGSPNDNKILGWQYRYSEFKTKYNKVQNNLMRNLHYWTPSRIFSPFSPDDHRPYEGVGEFLISPFYLDPVMLVGYQFGWDAAPDSEDEAACKAFNKALFSRDPLQHELYFNVHKSSKMSTYGLESL